MTSVIVDVPRQTRRSGNRYEDEYDYEATTVAPAYRDYEYRDTSNRGALIRPNQHVPISPSVHSHSPSVVEESVIEHEHHHLHHHIDHGDISGGTRHALSRANVARPTLGREYSYDDLDLRERRYTNGATVSTIHAIHAGHHDDRRRRHRHRHRRGSVERTRISRSDLDLTVTATSDRGGTRYEYENDDVTVVDVPPGTRRVYVNVEKQAQRDRERDFVVDWRREHGVRRSRGLGNELWTEITKDLVTREAIEDCGYPFEETDFFYYIFEYLDREQIAELRELTEDIRHERAKDIAYQSIAGSTPRVLPMGSRSDIDDTRTEIVVETGGPRCRSNSRHRKRYYY